MSGFYVKNDVITFTPTFAKLYLCTPNKGKMVANTVIFDMSIYNKTYRKNVTFIMCPIWHQESDPMVDITPHVGVNSMNYPRDYCLNNNHTSDNIDVILPGPYYLLG